MTPRWERSHPPVTCPGTFWVDDLPLYIIRFCLQSRGTIQFECEVERTQKLETLEKDRFFRAVALHHDTLTHLWLTWRLFVVHGLEIGVVVSNVLFSTLFGEMIQFDEHIFQMGWFNYQLEMYTYCLRPSVFSSNTLNMAIGRQLSRVIHPNLRCALRRGFYPAMKIGKTHGRGLVVQGLVVICWMVWFRVYSTWLELQKMELVPMMEMDWVASIKSNAWQGNGQSLNNKHWDFQALRDVIGDRYKYK